MLKHDSESENSDGHYTCFWMNLRTGEWVGCDDDILLHVSSFPLWDNKCEITGNMLEINSGYVSNLGRLFVYVDAEYIKSKLLNEEVPPVTYNNLSSKVHVNETADSELCESNKAGNEDNKDKYISSDHDTTLLDNRTSSNVTGSEEVNIEKNYDEADIIVNNSEKHISDNSSLELEAAIELGNLSNN